MSDVLAQADDLMRRHRNFVARAAEPATETPPQTASEDDIPLLTEVVAAIGATPDSTELDRTLDAAVSAWLAAALPAALTRASTALSAELAERARQELLPKLLEITKNGTRQKL